MLLIINQSMSNSKFNQSHRIINPKFSNNSFTVCFYCSDTEKEFFGYFSIAEFFTNQLQYFLFPLCEDFINFLRIDGHHISGIIRFGHDINIFGKESTAFRHSLMA